MSINRTERTVSALAMPTENGDLGDQRLESLASFNDQLVRHQRRLVQLDEQLARAGKPLPNRIDVILIPARDTVTNRMVQGATFGRETAYSLTLWKSVLESRDEC